MATKNITQLRRIVFRKYDATASSWSVPMVLTPEDLGQDSVMTFNIAPRMKERATQMGTTNAPIQGTFDELSASITFLADDWAVVGKALQKWNAATYTGATAQDGQMLGDDANLCLGNEYVSVVAQGICDDGSSADVEFTRCLPTIDGEIELGTSSSVEVTLALNPQIYNATTMASDGYGAYTFRLGAASLTENQRLNAATGAYATAETSSTNGD